MKQILNGYDEQYYLTPSGEVYNSKTDKYIQPTSYIYNLKKTDGTRSNVSLKTLYQLVYAKNYCIDTIPDLPEESWKEVSGSGGAYLVSNKGRIKSLKGYESIILKENKEGKYPRVDVFLYGQRYAKLVSRIVASAWLPAPENEFQQLHHIDRNPQNSNADNLVWLDPEKHREIHKKLNKEQQKSNGSAKSKKNNN